MVISISRELVAALLCLFLHRDCQCIFSAAINLSESESYCAVVALKLALLFNTNYYNISIPLFWLQSLKLDPTNITMNCVPRSVHYFIDNEPAGVDDTDLDEEQDLQDPLIDDTDANIFAGCGFHLAMGNRIMSDEGVEDNKDNNIVSENSLRDLSLDEEDLSQKFWGILSTRATTTADINSKSRLYNCLIASRYPGMDDYPLWRIECRIGSEEQIILSLLKYANASHQLRSAFSRGSLRGCIYLECFMNTCLLELLAEISGVSHNSHGIRRHQVQDHSDSLKLLQMPSIQNGNTAVGDWVTITKGLYRGDIGLVSAAHNWGVNVLLIPRLTCSDIPEIKGKRSKFLAVKYSPKLFNAAEFGLSSTKNLVCLPDGSYILGRLRLSHGLVMKAYDYHSVGSQVGDIPWHQFSLYASAGHPNIKLANLPRPQEWTFIEGERVTIRSSGKRGVIYAIGATHVDIELWQEGRHQFTWHEVQKDISVGDFVCIMSGFHKGLYGWIVDLNGDVASLRGFETVSQDADDFQEIPGQYLDQHWMFQIHLPKSTPSHGNCFIITTRIRNPYHLN
ncbi:hypothetical protein BDN70DRAFT_900583 [Pholiota conissans]|uniref:Chromatin elongation factor SPT5 n=1 Tax=Pholiota conissans TaxID=109636 RepID=A0A9P5YNW6_9AGAR|nr:hypothetical protein BDN70DRAFT_900583 [Pholiota conissans]